MSVARFPATAPAATLMLASSSSARPVGRSPTAQTVPLATGQIVNSGADTPATPTEAAVTVTLWAAARVLHTQIT